MRPYTPDQQAALDQAVAAYQRTRQLRAEHLEASAHLKDELRAALDAGVRATDLAERFGVSRPRVYQIVGRLT